MAQTQRGDQNPKGHPPKQSPDPNVKLGRYSLEGELGRGGMGAVFKVHDTRLDRTLAMKVILEELDTVDGTPTPSASPQTLGRFLEEAKLTAQLEHPGIVPVHELGRDPAGRHYFTMRLVQGRTFAELLDLTRQGKDGWSRTRALGVLLKVCESMAFAHSRQVLHRDLKPENIMVGEFGEVYVMDWGLACFAGKEANRDIRLKVKDGPVDSGQTIELTSTLTTAEGDVVGTPSYMSPEQARGELDNVGPATDVYAAGAILYQVLAGHRPYAEPGSRRTPIDVWKLVCQESPAPLHTLTQGNPEELLAICEKAMARRPEDRYARMLDMADDIRAYIEHRVVKAYRTGAWAEFQKWVSRNKMLTSTIGVALFVVVSGMSTATAVLAKKNRDISAARDQARDAADEAQTINQFLIDDLLNAARPERSLGRKLPVEDVVLDAKQKIDTSLEGKPKVAAAIRSTLGDTFLKLGSLDQAKELLQFALDWQRANLGLDDPATLLTEKRMASYWAETNDYVKSDATISSLLERLTQLRGPDDPGTLEVLFLRAKILNKAEKFDAAMDVLKDLTERASRSPGLNIRRKLIFEGQMVMTRHSKGDMRGSVKELARLLQEERALYPPGHPHVIDSIEALASALHDLDDLTAAEPLYRESLEAYEKVYGRDHMTVAISCNNLGTLLETRYLRERTPALFDEAKALYERSLDIRKKTFGASSPAVGNAYLNLGNLYFSQRSLTKAEEYYLLARPLVAEYAGPESSKVLGVQSGLAAIYSQQKRWDLAEPLYRKTLDAFVKTKGESHWNTAFARSNLGKCLVMINQLEEGEQHLTTAYTQLAAALGGSHTYARDTASYLEKLYTRLGNPTKAGEWREKYTRPASGPTPGASSRPSAEASPASASRPK